jgi:hypothetical protein
VEDRLGKELQDFGAAVPTTVMFTGAALPNNDQGTASKMALDHFIGFRGTQHNRGKEGGLDDNLCVFQNFACGTHFYIPNEFNACLVDPAPHWFFFDSRSVPRNYANVPLKFYFALYLSCPNDDRGENTGIIPEDTSAGFIDIADSPTISLGDFMAQVMRAPLSEISDRAVSAAATAAAITSRGTELSIWSWLCVDNRTTPMAPASYQSAECRRKLWIRYRWRVRLDPPGSARAAMASSRLRTVAKC